MVRYLEYTKEMCRCQCFKFYETILVMIYIVSVHDIVSELNEAKTETMDDNYDRNNWCRKRN